MTDSLDGPSSSTPRQSMSSRSVSDSAMTDTLPPFRYDSQPPNGGGPRKREPPPGPSFQASSTANQLFPHPPSASSSSSSHQLHPPAHPSLADRRHSSASPPPHLPALTLQRPSAPHEQGGLPPISPLQPFDFASFDNRRRGSITDPSLHVATTTRGGSPRAGGLGGVPSQRSPTEISPASSSNPNSPTYHPPFPPSAYPFPNADQRRTSITSITSNTSSNTPPIHTSFYSPSPLSSTSKQLPPPSRAPFFPQSHLSSHDKRDNSVSPTSNGRTPTPADCSANNASVSPRSTRIQPVTDDRMSVDEGPLGESPRALPSTSEGRHMPTPSGLPVRPGLPRHTSNSGGNPSRPWTPNEDGASPAPFGKMQGVIVRESTTDAATAGEERDRFSNRLPQFDFSQRRHSIAVGYPTPSDSSAVGPPPPPPPPPGWSQAALKRKMSHDRAAMVGAGGPLSAHHPMDASEPPSPSSGPMRPPFPPNLHSSSSSASPSSEGGPTKRRGSAFDSKMTSLSLAERPEGGAGLAGGWWADRRDSAASLWSNASHVSSTQGGYGTSQTSYTGGGGGSGSEVGGGKQPGAAYAWPAPGAGGYHQPGARPWQPQSQGPTDPNSRSSSPVGGAAPSAPSSNGTAYQTPQEPGRAPVFRDLAGYSMDRTSSSARSSATVTNGPAYTTNSSPSSSVSPAGTSMPPPPPTADAYGSSNKNPHSNPHNHNHESTSSQGSYHQMSSHLAPPSAAALAAQQMGEGSGGEGGDTPYSRSPELRVSHKLAERKRRKEMKELFDELKDHLPADRGMKSSKWEILSKAVDYINHIKSTAEAKDREIEHLRHELSLSRGGGGSHLPPPPPISSSSSSGPQPSYLPHPQQQYLPHPLQHPHSQQGAPPPPHHQQQQQPFAPSAVPSSASQPFAPGYVMGAAGGAGFAPHAQREQSSVRSSYSGPSGGGQ